MNDDNKAPKTWKEWAIEMSTDQENLKDRVKENCQKYDNLLEKHDELKEKFIRLETRVYIFVPAIIVVMEILIKKLLG